MPQSSCMKRDMSYNQNHLFAWFFFFESQTWHRFVLIRQGVYKISSGCCLWYLHLKHFQCLYLWLHYEPNLEHGNTYRICMIIRNKKVINTGINYLIFNCKIAKIYVNMSNYESFYEQYEGSLRSGDWSNLYHTILKLINMVISIHHKCIHRK